MKGLKVLHEFLIPFPPVFSAAPSAEVLDVRPRHKSNGTSRVNKTSADI